MAVIINDFEIAVEAPQAPAPDEGVAPPDGGGPTPPPRPSEIVSVMRWARERRSRVDAT